MRLPTLCSRLAVYPLAAACLRLPTLCSRLAVYPLAAACLRLPTLCSRLAVYPLAAACLRLPTLCSRLAVYPLAAACLRLPTLCSRLAVYPLAASGGARYSPKNKKKRRRKASSLCLRRYCVYFVFALFSYVARAAAISSSIIPAADKYAAFIKRNGGGKYFVKCLVQVFIVCPFCDIQEGASGGASRVTFVHIEYLHLCLRQACLLRCLLNKAAQVRICCFHFTHNKGIAKSGGGICILLH